MPESSQAQTAPHRERTSPQRSESLWGNPTYRQWFTADTASTIGAAMRGFAISLIAFSLTQSVVLAGWLATFSQIATHVSDVFGGTVVDRHNRKGLIIANAVFGTLLWGTVFVLIALHAIAFPIFAIVTVAASAVNGLLANATNAMLRTIIPTREYPKAQSLNQGRDSVVSIAGSPLGGVLYAVAPWLPFAVASLMYAISGVSAAQLRVDEHVRDMVTTDRKSKRPDTASQAGCTSDTAVAPDADATAEPAHTSFFEDFIEGWRWTLRRHTLLAICVIAALVNFGLNGVFAAVNLQLVSTHVDSVRLGFVNTVMGVGMLIGAAFAHNFGLVGAAAKAATETEPAGRVCERVHMGTGLVVLSVTSLLTLLPMLFSSDYLVILASSLIVGLPIPTINSLLMGFVFAKVPSEMQGRVESASDMLSMIPTLFCSALAGSLLPRIGFGATIGLFLAVLAVNVVIALLMPSIRSLPAADHWDDASL